MVERGWKFGGVFYVCEKDVYVFLKGIGCYVLLDWRGLEWVGGG